MLAPKRRLSALLRGAYCIFEVWRKAGGDTTIHSEPTKWNGVTPCSVSYCRWCANISFIMPPPAAGFQCVPVGISSGAQVMDRCEHVL